MTQLESPELLLTLICKGLIDLYQKVESGKNFEFPYPKYLQQGYNKLLNFYIQQEQTPPYSLVELVRWCEHKSLSEWNLNISEELIENEEYLLYKQEPTELCEELSQLIEEHGAFQKKLIGKVMSLCQSQQNPEMYIDFRGFLCDRSNSILDYLRKKNFRNKVPRLASEIEEIYQEIPEIYVIDDKLYQCDRCGYLIVKNSEGKRVCKNKKCRRKYKPKFQAVKGTPPFYLLHEEVHRFITLPGQAELELEEKLKKISPNLQVEIWKEYDKHDLYVTFSNNEKWAIDVKDWKNPYLLAQKLNSDSFPPQPEWDKAFYVIPDRRHKEQEDYIRSLKNHYRRKDIQVVYSKNLVSRVKKNLDKINA
ncbi:MAG: hypothetical protein QNJ32_05380 [Xenococcaceae cyanobacterium MO_167.B27]|nr:hypothetical protein [Xenococcaceae cyanobacterium MO_167.B27]